VKLSDTYESMCSYKVADVVKGIIRRVAYGEKLGLAVVCKTRRVEGCVMDGITSIGHDQFCRCPKGRCGRS